MPSTASAFPSTHWSIVLQAGAEGEGQAAVALETLCRRYWYPVYGFIRRQGRAHHEAEDLTQAFFAHLLANAGLTRAQPARGRFRTFLLASLRHFLANEWHRSVAVRRGGGAVFEPLVTAAGEERFAREGANDEGTPEQAFDRRWALDLIEGALTDLRGEYAAGGRGALFDALAPLVWGGRPRQSLRTEAEAIGLNEGALKVALHRLRKRLGERLRERVLATVEREDEAADELRHLMNAVGGAGHPL